MANAIALVEMIGCHTHTHTHTHTHLCTFQMPRIRREFKDGPNPQNVLHPRTPPPPPSGRAFALCSEDWCRAAPSNVLGPRRAADVEAETGVQHSGLLDLREWRGTDGRRPLPGGAATSQGLRPKPPPPSGPPLLTPHGPHELPPVRRASPFFGLAGALGIDDAALAHPLRGTPADLRCPRSRGAVPS